MAWRDVLQKLAGDQPAQGDEITPTGSPIDLVAGGLGSALGGSMARGAAPLLGNEIGAIGANVAKTAAPTAEQFAANSLAPRAVAPAQALANAAADSQAPQQVLNQGQQALSRAMDMADRAKLQRFQALKQKLGR